MIKVRVKAPWMDGKGLHKIGDIAEIETAAFDPLRMEEIRAKSDVKPIKVEEDPEPPKKTTKKSTKKG
jgi:hypothetical protein